MSAEAYEILRLLINTIGTVLLAYIAYKQLRLTKSMNLLEKNTNSMKDELVAEVRAASLAKGNLQGRKEIKYEEATTAATSPSLP